jgi:selenocysteine lyase/cysteine desulfurase
MSGTIHNFDNASTSFPKHKSVYQAITQYEQCGLNFDRSFFEFGQSVCHAKAGAIDNLRKLLSTEDPDFICVLNPSATYSLNEILSGLDYCLDGIRNVYISPFEHHAVYRTLVHLAKSKQFKLHVLPFNEFKLDYLRMLDQFSVDKPDLVVCTHASNVFGNILPVGNIFSEAKHYNAITVLDTAQTGGCVSLAGITEFCDFIVFAGHKNLYGPSGIGGYFYRQQFDHEPLVYGGTGVQSDLPTMPDLVPSKFEAGSANIFGLIALRNATSESLELGLQQIRTIKNYNLRKLLAVLSKYTKHIDIKSPYDDNAGIVSVVPKHITCMNFSKQLANNNIVVRVGYHCSSLANEHIGTTEEGTVRFSIGIYNTVEDFEVLDHTLSDIFGVG